MISIMAAVAEIERENIKEQTMATRICGFIQDNRVPIRQCPASGNVSRHCAFVSVFCGYSDWPRHLTVPVCGFFQTLFSRFSSFPSQKNPRLWLCVETMAFLPALHARNQSQRLFSLAQFCGVKLWNIGGQPKVIRSYCLDS